MVADTRHIGPDPQRYPMGARLDCPKCGEQHYERLPPNFFDPLLPPGYCYARCKRCDYKGEMATADWRQRQETWQRMDGRR